MWLLLEDKTFWPIHRKKKLVPATCYLLLSLQNLVFTQVLFPLSVCLYIESAWKFAFVFTGDLLRHFPVLRWWISILFFVESKKTATFFCVHLPFFNFNIPVFVCKPFHYASSVCCCVQNLVFAECKSPQKRVFGDWNISIIIILIRNWSAV